MHIATRHYDDRHPVTHEWFDLEDRLYRKPDGGFALLIAGELPGDPPVVMSLSLSEVFEWLTLKRLLSEGRPLGWRFYANSNPFKRAR